MFGGWDGINILDKNSAKFGDKATSTETGGCANSSYVSPGATGINYSGVGLNNNAVNSFKVAIDIATDPLVSKSNVLVISWPKRTLGFGLCGRENKRKRIVVLYHGYTIL